VAPWALFSTRATAGPLGLGFSPALLWSVSATLVVLFAMGAGKSLLARRPALVGGIEIAAIGALSGCAGYLLGTFLPRALGAHLGGLQ